MNAPRCVRLRRWASGAYKAGQLRALYALYRSTIGPHTRGAFDRVCLTWRTPWLAKVRTARACSPLHPPSAMCCPAARSALTGARPGPRGSLARACPMPAHRCAHQPHALLAGRNGGRAGAPRWSPVLVARLCCQQCAPLSLTLLAVLPAQAIGEPSESHRRAIGEPSESHGRHAGDHRRTPTAAAATPHSPPHCHHRRWSSALRCSCAADLWLCRTTTITFSLFPSSLPCFAGA
jgi:hypothetical protein